MMLCRKPYMAGAIPFGCGQCLPCRVNRRRLWTWRQVLESYSHDDSSFVTLTYDGRNIPGNWQLEPRALQLFLKSLRKACAPHRLRFFACGEYGEQNHRPHYHLSLFGLSGHNSVHGEPVVSYDRKGHTAGGLIHRIWGRGYVDVQEFNHVTAHYVTGYVSKKLVDRRDNRNWIVPEFARMSLRPGLGREAIREVGQALLRNYETSLRDRDVPNQLLLGGKKIPLSRSLLRYLRYEVGFSDDYAKKFRDQVSFERSVEMLALFENSPDDATFRQTYLKAIEAKLEQVEARYGRWKPRREL